MFNLDKDWAQIDTDELTDSADLIQKHLKLGKKNNGGKSKKGGKNNFNRKLLKSYFQILKI